MFWKATPEEVLGRGAEPEAAIDEVEAWAEIVGMTTALLVLRKTAEEELGIGAEPDAPPIDEEAAMAEEAEPVPIMGALLLPC